jgi:VCBS repeat-containing protein
VKPGIDELPPKLLPDNCAMHPSLARHFVFIDVRVPDLDTLIHGATDSREVHVLAADRDSLRQVADILAARAASRLSSIAIVAHGAPGVLTFGGTKLGAADLAGHAAILAAIGATLAPEGRIDLYACDLAAGPEGQRFISEFARRTGAHIAGASHPIGSADGNGCWTLDVCTAGGAIEIPFTGAARAIHRGVLTDPTIDTQLYYTLNGPDGLNGPNGPRVLRLDTDSVTHAAAGLQRLYAAPDPLGDVAVDPSAGLYFVEQHSPANSPDGDAIAEGSLNQQNPVQTVVPASFLFPRGLAIDAAHGNLYYGQQTVFGLIGSYVYAPGSPPIQFTKLFLLNDLVAFAVDPDSRVWAIDRFGRLEVSNETHDDVTVVFDPGGLTNLAYAANAKVFFFEATSVFVFTQKPVNGHAGAILLYEPIANPTGSYKVLYSEDTPGLGPHGTLTHIAIDPQHLLYYVTDEGEADATRNGIYVGSLSSPDAPTLMLPTGTASFGGLTLNVAPTFATLAGTTSYAVQGVATPVPILDSSATIIQDELSPLSGPDTSAMLASATVRITDARSGDQLYAGGLQSGTLDRGKITVAWNETTHTLTLTGRDTVAAYTAALNSFGYADLGSDTATAGHAQRGFALLVNDGQLDSATNVSTLTIDRPPIVAADSATGGTFLQISDNVLTNDSDPDGDKILVSALAGGSVGTLLHATFGDFKLNANGDYTYFAGATADEQAALAAAPNGAHAVETFSYTASDGLGGLASTTLTITIDRAMMLTTPASVSYVEGSAPISLAPAGTIGSVDAASLDTGWLSVAGSNLTGSDQLTILSDGGGAGQISVVGSAVSYQGVEIGTIDSIANGYNGAGLTIYFNGSATAEAAQALLEHLQFSNSDPGPTIGARNLTLQFRDSLGHLTASSETIDVTPLNHAPSFVAGSNQIVNEDSGLQTVAAWASNIFAGAANEAAQTLDFLASNDNPGLFAIAPAIAPDGTLTYTPAHDASGSAIVKIKLHDDGGTGGGGGSDTSAEQTFTITVTTVNDAPSFTAGLNQIVNEDAGAQSVAWASNISAGPPNESGQMLDFLVSNDNPGLFAIAPAIAPDGTLTYTPAHDASGSAIVKIKLHDDGGTGGGGSDTSAEQTFTITVTTVNDAPSFAAGSNQTVNEDAGLQTVAAWAGNIVPGAANEAGQTLDFLVSNDNPGLFAAASAIAPDGTLTYTPAHDASGSATVKVKLHDDGGTAGGGSDTSAEQTFTITVTAVNDAPSFTAGSDQTVNEDAGAQTIAGWAMTISAGPLDESGQSIDFLVSNDNPGLFATAPAIEADGTLTYTSAHDASGSATVTVRLHDSGGTENGGTDISTGQSFVITVDPANDAPVLSGVSAQANLPPGGGALTLSPHLTAGDVDNATLVAASVHISAGAFAGDGDVLAVDANGLAGTSIVANYSAATETLTLSGTDTLAHYSQVLEHVTFQTSAVDPTNAGADPTRTVDWQLNDGSATGNLSTIETTTVHLSGPPTISTPTPTPQPPANDFDSDGHSDLLWQNADGTPAVWLISGTSLISGSNIGFNPGSHWHEIGSGDFNSDGKSDILWQNTDGTIAEWLMDGRNLVSGASVAFNPGPSWHAIGTGDFNGDGKADIVWQNQDGTPAVWLMDGLNILSGANVGFNPGSAWHVIGAGDFNGDGKADILWQNADGTPAVWLMDGTNLLSGSNVGFNPGSSWHAIGTGDFNGDGKADILWQNADGTPAVWLMNGTQLISGQNVGFNPGANWHVLNTGDYNGDGKADILWQNADGTPAVWLMNGTQLISGANVGFDPGSNWHLIPQHHDLFG